MGWPNVKWGCVEKYFKNHGYDVYSQGGDKVIYAPKDGDTRRQRQMVVIGHNYSDHKGDKLSPGHLAKIRRAFGVTAEQILAEC